MDNTQENIVKASICQKCNGWVRIAAREYLETNTKARNEFIKEVMKYNLSVSEIPLKEWNESKIKRCNCN